jgi:D-glycero-D-manno-heptose 1,7-bisphosphate phosphatase
MARAICLDRDGTLIEDVGYPRDPAKVRLVAGAAEALGILKNHGFLLVLISNQSGIGRGIITQQEADRVHQRVIQNLAAEKIMLDGAYYCPHAPEAGCGCRKPSPGLLHQASLELGFTLARSYMIGDKPSDVEAGWRAGCRTIHLRRGAVGFLPTVDAVACDWAQAVRWILQAEEKSR